MDGAVLGLLDEELRHRRTIARIHYSSESKNAKEPKTRRREKRAPDVVVCPNCGTLWEAEAFIRKAQLVETEKEYVVEARRWEPR